MNSLINFISTWLTSPHAIELMGWQWIVFGPILLIIGMFLVIWMFLSSLGKFTLPW